MKGSGTRKHGARLALGVPSARVRASGPADLLTISVGNSTVMAAVWTAQGERRRASMKFALSRTLRGLRAVLRQLGPGEVVLAGVVPKVLATLRTELRQAGCARVRRFRRDLPCPLEIVPRPARQVGDDRLAAALGALGLDPRRPWVVVDAGTALTVNAVRPATEAAARMGILGRFEGGLIVPGEALALWALSAGTAQLPFLKPWPAAKAAPAVGRSTAEALRAGVRRARIATVIALARAQAETLGPGVRLALTGGGAKALWPAVRRELRSYRPVLVPDLVLRGLRVAWRAEQGRASTGRSPNAR